MIKNLDWNLLQSFLAVSEHGSFSAAARATNGSQATLSRHISVLEEQLDTHLFSRAVGGAELTKRGMEVLQHATNMADEAGRLSLDIDGHESVISGTVRITAVTTIATYTLPKILAALRIEEPEIEIELVATNKRENLLRREADIAIRFSRPTEAGLFARKVGETRFGTYAAHSYLERRPAPTTAEEILNHDMIGFDTSDIIINGLTRLGLKVDRDFFTFRCDDPVVGWNMVVEGYGIGFNRLEIGEVEPKVSRIKLPNTIEPLQIWLVAHSELKTNLRVRRVFDFLAEKLSTTAR